VKIELIRRASLKMKQELKIFFKEVVFPSAGVHGEGLESSSSCECCVLSSVCFPIPFLRNIIKIKKHQTLTGYRAYQ
jgi:hypothetical protein